VTGGDPQAALIDECNRQSENCGYTATTFIIWLRVLRHIRLIFVVLPILCGALAAWKVMADSPAWAATMVLLATAIPPVLALFSDNKSPRWLPDCNHSADDFIGEQRKNATPRASSSDLVSERVIAEIMGWSEDHVGKIIRKYVDRSAATKAVIRQLNARGDGNGR
jgi:hypothetical protein